MRKVSPMETSNALIKMALLETAYAHLCKYTSTPEDEFRPGLVDLYVYDILVSAYEKDYEDVNFMDYLWRVTPDEAMLHIIENNKIFSLEFGDEYIYEELMDYLGDKELIIHVDDATEEEYQSNLEGRVDKNPTKVVQ
jgi:hypothetical protein